MKDKRLSTTGIRKKQGKSTLAFLSVSLLGLMATTILNITPDAFAQTTETESVQEYD